MQQWMRMWQLFVEGLDGCTVCVLCDSEVGYLTS